MFGFTIAKFVDLPKRKMHLIPIANPKWWGLPQRTLWWNIFHPSQSYDDDDDDDDEGQINFSMAL